MSRQSSTRVTCPTCHGDGRIPNPDAPCRCGHRYAEHHYSPGGGCCVEVDRYELCRCTRFRASAKRVATPATLKRGQVWERQWKGRTLRVEVNAALPGALRDSVQVKTANGMLRWMWADSLTRLYRKTADA